MADVATEFGDQSLSPALEALWDHLVQKNLYVTGGFGPSADNEGLTFDYDLPNATAYAETCAAVALVFWASRMLGQGPKARYADVMERALYNGALVGLSQDGTRFFYDNPLESRGSHHRWIWHHCPCCPPNIARLLASIGTYAYGVAEEGIAVHLYAASEANLEIAGLSISIHQETAYPLDGQVTLTLEPAQPATFSLYLRVPGWARDMSVKLNNAVIETEGVIADGYLRLHREWRAGDQIILDIAMPVVPVYSHPAVGANQGRVTLTRGPLGYCLEEQDNGPSLNELILQRGSRFRCEPAEDLAGAIALLGEAMREKGSEADGLYRVAQPTRSTTTVRAIPYYAWDNRCSGEMLVWIREEP